MQSGQHLSDGRATESRARSLHRSCSAVYVVAPGANRIEVYGRDPAGALARQNGADACLRTEHERLQPDTG